MRCCRAFLGCRCATPSAWSLDALLDSVERCVKVTEPLYALLAATLVLLDAFVFFTTVISEVCGPTRREGGMRTHAWTHA